MNEGRARYAREDGTWLIKLEGDVRHPLSPGVNALLDRIFTDHELRQVSVDLTEVQAIDSTNLGVLARIANHMASTSRPQPSLIAPSADIQKILRSVCFDRIFRILPDPAPAPDALETMPELDADERARLALVLEAHRRLSHIDPRNESRFRDLIELLEKEEHG